MKKKKELHLRQAEAAQVKIQHLAKEASKKPEEVHVIAVDLQQAMPTPKLTVGPAFYKRKLWTYNLGIHDCGANSGYMYMWSEDVAKRGSDEIGSCIIKYLENLNLCPKILHIISDNCKGQNKNWNIVALSEALVRSGRFQTVKHHFPVVGHTYLPCDRDFGVIEKHVKNRQIYSPKQWAEAVQSARKTKPFTVYMMQSEDFKHVSMLHQQNTMRSTTDEGTKLEFSRASIFCFDAEVKGVLRVCYSYSMDNEKYENLPIVRRGRPALAMDPFALPSKGKAKIPIPAPKLDDIKSLMTWVPSPHKKFYESLQRGKNLEDDPRLVDNTLDPEEQM